MAKSNRRNKRNSRRSARSLDANSRIIGVESGSIVVAADPTAVIKNIIPGYGGSQFDAVLNCYGEVKYNKCVFEYIPSLSTSHNGRVYFYLVENPEDMANNNTALSGANAVTYAANTAWTRSTPIWKPMKWDITRFMNRRPWYDSNITVTTTDPDVMERSCPIQFIAVVVASGITETTEVGLMRHHSVCVGRNLRVQGAT